LGFWSLVPAIARQGRAFSLLTGLVLLGGLARLMTAVRLGVWGPSVVLPLIMELGVTPALWLWQRRVARSSNSSPE
jgi:p-aminobenzoyl-glutamate transporter AbgT